MISLTSSDKFFLPKTVLFVSELGGGRGHIARLNAVASIAKSLGYRTVLAVRAENASFYLQQNLDFDRVIEGPRFPRLQNVPPIFQVAGLAASLARVGFVDHRVVAPLISQWQQILTELNPSLVVGDFAPYARLATLDRIPFLTVGSGYTIPTTDGLLPFSLSGSRRDPTQLIKHILEETNKGLNSTGSRSIEDPSDCLRGDWNAVACVPILDPAFGRNQQEYFGPFEDFPRAQIKTVGGSTMYAYLHSVRKKDCNAINVLTEAGYLIDLYCDGTIEAPLHNVAKLEAPLSLVQIVERYSIVLHEGGLGLSTLCLQAALPQLLSPKHTEASMTAEKLSVHGCGVVMNTPHNMLDVESFVSGLRQLLDIGSTKARGTVASETRNWIENRNWKSRIQAILSSL